MLCLQVNSKSKIVALFQVSKHILNGDVLQRISGDVRVVNADTEQLGIMNVSDALSLAAKQRLDLMLVSSAAIPPVVKVVSYKKFLYEQQKKEKASRPVVMKQKEFRFSLTIAQNDLQIKVNKIRLLLDDGHPIKVVIMKMYNEQDAQVAEELLEVIFEQIKDLAKRDENSEPEVGKQNMTVQFVPLVSAQKKKKEAAAAAARLAASTSPTTATAAAAVTAKTPVSSSPPSSSAQSDQQQQQQQQPKSSLAVDASEVNLNEVEPEEQEVEIEEEEEDEAAVAAEVLEMHADEFDAEGASSRGKRKQVIRKIMEAVAAQQHKKLKAKGGDGEDQDEEFDEDDLDEFDDFDEKELEEQLVASSS